MVTSKFPPKTKKAAAKKQAAPAGKCRDCGMPKAKCKC